MKKVLPLLLLIIMLSGTATYAGNHSPGITVYLDHLRDEPFVLAVLGRNETEKVNNTMDALNNLPLFENNASGYFVIKIVQSDWISSQTRNFDETEKVYSAISMLPLKYDFKIAVQYLSGEFAVSAPVYINEKSRQGKTTNYADVLFDVESKNTRLLASGYDSGMDNMPPVYSLDRRLLFCFFGIPLIILVFTQISIKIMQSQRAKKAFRKIRKE